MKLSLAACLALVRMGSASGTHLRAGTSDGHDGGGSADPSEPVYPVWYEKGQSIVGPPFDDPFAHAGIGQLVSVTSRGEMIAEAHLIPNDDDNDSNGGSPRIAAQINAYAWVDVLQKWMPMADNQPVTIRLPDKSFQFNYMSMDLECIEGEYGVLAASANGVKVGQETNVFQGQLEIWFVSFYGGDGKSGTKWERYGNLVTRNFTEPKIFGASLDLAASGSAVAVGVPTFNPDGNGSIEVYHYAENGGGYDDDWDDYSWQLLGSPILASFPHFGQLVSISQDGNVVIGSGQGLTPESSCTIKAFSYSKLAGDWKQLGKDISPKGGNALRCQTLDLSGDGTTLVVGPFMVDEDNPEIKGHTRVYQYDKLWKRWRQKGQDLELINPLNGNHLFGSSLSISHDGNRVVVGVAEEHDDPMQVLEYSNTYEYDKHSKSWSRVGGGLVGELWSSFATKMSDDGKTLVVGAAGGAEDQGTFKAFQFAGMESAATEE